MTRRPPQVAAIHDLSGYGRCSLSVVLPTLAVMGVNCVPLPTAFLSAHTGFPRSAHAVFLDLTDSMATTAAHWNKLGVKFNAIYSGFLSSAAQIGVLLDFIAVFRKKNTLVLIDPVMGDHGTIYRSYTPALCRDMVSLAQKADIITPNLTEAAILLGQPPHFRPEGQDGAADWLHRLSLSGSRSVVLTGVGLKPGETGAACFDRDTGDIDFVFAQEVPGRFSGSGDLFAAVTLGELLREKSLSQSVTTAVNFTQQCAAYSLSAGISPTEGIAFAPMLSELITKM